MKKKNKKGFTLIELLAVIVILAIIALIAVPVVINIITKAQKSAFKDTAYGIIKAGDLYRAKKEMMGDVLEEFVFEFPDDIEGLEIVGSVPNSGIMKITSEGDIGIAISNGKYCITKGYEDKDIELTENIDNCIIPIRISNLVLSNSFLEMEENEEKTLEVSIEPNEATNKSLKWTSSDETVATVENGLIIGKTPGFATITVETTDKSNIKKEINLVVGYPYVNGIMSSRDECVKEDVCSPGTIVKVQVNDTQTHKFYVLKDENNEVILIMDRNLGDDVAWYADAQDNRYGPITALIALQSQTSTWTNLPEMIIDTYDLDNSTPASLENNQSFTMYARLPKYSEINKAIEDNEGIRPTWLYINLYNTGDNIKDSKGRYKYGYWTSTAYATLTSYVHIVRYDGLENCNNTNNDTCYGVRPVIELSK